MKYFKVAGLKYLLEFWEKILQWRLCCIGTTHSKSGLSQGQKGENFRFENLNFYSWNDYFKHRAHGLSQLVCSQFVLPKFSKLGVFRVICCIPPTLGKIFRRGFRGFGSLCTFLLSFFWDCLGAAPTFDVDFNIYCSLALGRGFANPQFEEEGKP